MDINGESALNSRPGVICQESWSAHANYRVIAYFVNACFVSAKCI